MAALAGEARAQGLSMVATPDKVIDSPYTTAAKAWPMLAWYLADEPEVHKVPLARLQELEARVNAWSPAQPTAFVVGSGLGAFTYGVVADALMVDWYPVVHLPLESVGLNVAQTVQGAALDKKRPGKPVWAVIQAFDWLDYPQLRKPPVGRFPDLAEIRFMTYLAVMRGAAGIFYFQLHDKAGKPLYEIPGRWAFFEKTVGELNVLLPALDGGKRGPAPAGLDPRLAGAVISGHGRRFLILANPTDKPLPLAPGLGGWRPLFEEKRGLNELLPAVEGRLYMPPYRVLVFEKRNRFLFF